MAEKYRTHEITFCARVKAWAEALFKSRNDLPFARVDIEESRDIGRKRSDLRFYRSKTDRNPIISEKVKMSGTVEGRNPYDYKLIEDAHATFSCSHHVSEAAFAQTIADALVDARRSARKLRRFEQALDHPVLPTIPETEYFKGILLEMMPGR